MPIKIIERGDEPEPWPRRFSCGECNSVLEVGDTDMTLPGQRDIPAVAWWKCPVCGVTHYLNEEDTASVIKSVTRKKMVGDNAKE